MKRCALLTAVVLATACAGNASAVVAFSDFSDTSGLAIGGDASTVATRRGTVLRLTPAINGQAGAAFGQTPVNAAGFSTYFTFRVTDPHNNGPADGIVFVAQAAPYDLGAGGGGIGYEGIPNSIGVEFDNWDNGAVDGFNDRSENHVGIDIDGDMMSLASLNVAIPFAGGYLWHSWIDYDGTNLDVRLSTTDIRPEAADLSYALDVPAILGQRIAFIGFTSATGAANANHDIVSWEYQGTAGASVVWDFENGNDHGFTLSSMVPPIPREDDPDSAGDEALTGGLPEAGVAWTIGPPGQFDGQFPVVYEGCNIVRGVLQYNRCSDPFDVAEEGDIGPFDFTNGRGQSGYLGTYALNQWGDFPHIAENDQIATSRPVLLQEDAVLTTWAFGNTTASSAGVRIAPQIDPMGAGYVTGSGGIAVLSAGDGSLLASLLVAAEAGEGRMPDAFTLDLSAFAGQEVIIEVVDAFDGAWGWLAIDEIMITHARTIDVVNVDFARVGEEQLLVMRGQGAFPDPGHDLWNIASATPGTVEHLRTSDGRTTGLTLSGITANSWDNAGTSFTARPKALMADYLYVINERSRVIVSGLHPNSDYTLYLYGAGDNTGQGGVFTIGDVSVTVSGPSPLTSELVPGEDYEIAIVVSDANGELEIVWKNIPEKSKYGCFNGFQLIGPIE